MVQQQHKTGSFPTWIIVLPVVLEYVLLLGWWTESSNAFTRLETFRDRNCLSRPSSTRIALAVMEDGPPEPTTTTATTTDLEAFREAVVHHSAGEDATRILHGRGGTYPGLEHITLDWFPPVWLLTSYNRELQGDELDAISKTVKDHCKTTHVTMNDDDDVNFNLAYQFRSPTKTTTEILHGSVPDPHVVTEHGMKFFVQLPKAKNHGIFLDMRHGRDWVRDYCQQNPNCKVLNLFAYTCGFSIAALQGGAESCVNMDMVNGVLKTGQRNHELNGFQRGQARFLAHDIFKSWGKIRKLGPYDVIVVDPPSFQKNSFVAKKDYSKIIRRLPGFLKDENSHAMLCLNAPELTDTWLQELVSEETSELEFVTRLENPSTFPSKDPERALKVLLYRKKESPEA